MKTEFSFFPSDVSAFALPYKLEQKGIINNLPGFSSMEYDSVLSDLYLFPSINGSSF